MERHLPEPPLYLKKVPELNQAIFYCYNSSSQRIPVGMISDFAFKDDDTLLFSIKYFPVTEMCWDLFAAELHFYKKDTGGSFVLHGVAVVENNNMNSVAFRIHNAVYTSEPAKISNK